MRVTIAELLGKITAQDGAKAEDEAQKRLRKEEVEIVVRQVSPKGTTFDATYEPLSK